MEKIKPHHPPGWVAPGERREYMYLFKGIIIIMAFVIIFLSIKMRKIPKGIIEWMFIIGAFAILINGLVK